MCVVNIHEQCLIVTIVTYMSSQFRPYSLRSYWYGHMDSLDRRISHWHMSMTNYKLEVVNEKQKLLYTI